MNPDGVIEMMPSRIATQPSHFGSAPWRTTERPDASMKTEAPIDERHEVVAPESTQRLGRSGIDVVDLLHQRDVDRRVDSDPDCHDRNSREHDGGEHAALALGYAKQPAQIAAVEHQATAAIACMIDEIQISESLSW